MQDMQKEVDDKTIRNFVRIIGVLSVLILTGLSVALFKWKLITVLVFACVVFYYMAIQEIKPKTKWVKTLKMVLLIPAEVLMGLVWLCGPALGAIVAIFCATIVNIFISGAITGLYWITAEKPSCELVLFVFMCIETILLSNHTDTMKKWIHKIGFVRMWEQEESKSKLIVMGDYFFQSENMHFIVSLAYVIFLFTMAFFNISSNAHVFSAEIDNAIWKAFLVYGAYSTMMTRYQKTEATVDDTAREIYKMLFAGRIDFKEKDDVNVEDQNEEGH